MNGPLLYKFTLHNSFIPQFNQVLIENNRIFIFRIISTYGFSCERIGKLASSFKQVNWITFPPAKKLAVVVVNQKMCNAEKLFFFQIRKNDRGTLTGERPFWLFYLLLHLPTQWHMNENCPQKKLEYKPLQTWTAMSY